MPAPPLPPDEERRLQALRTLNLLDTAPEERFDRVTRLAADLFGVPVAMVGLVDARREWFKSRVGGLGPELPRALSLSAHAIVDDAGMVVEDALADERFAAHPLVTGEPGIRFYAAAPLAAPDGSKVGTLCLIDRAPRRFDARQRALLRDLAAIVAREFAADELQGALARERESAAGLRALIDQLPEGVLVLDENAVVLSANRAAGALFGAEPDALGGRGVESLAADADSVRLAGQAEDAVVTRQLSGRRVDGSIFSLDLTARAVVLDGRRRYAAIVRDAAAPPEHALGPRAASERRHKTFTLASHELRTPLASIIGFTELLLKREFDAPTARELVEIVHAQAATLTTVLNQIFDLARIEAGGRRALHIAPESVNAVLLQAMGSIEALGQNARVVLAVDPGLPPVAADAHRLAMAFSNVLSNSLRYSDEGSPVTVRAWSEAAPAPGAVLVRVSDQGTGMSQEERERLFESFYRGAGARGTVGTGLGMAIFKEIIDLHEAGVEVASSPGKGTSVTVRLPIAGEVTDA
ncbi:ATP-binding protein [Massilia jejuensis]|uniref:histidine kinase n=1 Tax=Massilia jejuensis TaxID=648894 RepID=A0ABW0PDW6_9BURK